MVSYYSTLILLCWIALGVLCFLVWENTWIPKKSKRLFYLTYGIIALSALTEWLGIQLSGNTDIPSWLLSLVKCTDYILTPMTGYAVVAQMGMHNRWYKALIAVIAANAVFQVAASFNGWMIIIDGENRYTHGPLYWLYILVYLLIIAIVAVEFRSYAVAYRRQNRASLYSALLLVIVGIAIQELLGGEFRTAYVAITMGVALMLIHYAEFYHMTADDRIKQQQSELMTDALSGVYSRHAYVKAVEAFKSSTALPENTTVFSIDINGLKAVNDTEGHDAGDVLIVGAARCIQSVFADSGPCFRTGGDEFIVLGQMTQEEAENALLRLADETAQWSADKQIKLSLSAGYARGIEHKGFTIEELIKKADQAMYTAKTNYYKQNGLTSRGLHYAVES